MLSLSNAQPGATDTSCLLVTYSGSLSSTVKLYGSIAGALAPYLTLTVTRGDDPTPIFDDCVGFQPDGRTTSAPGQGVIYQGALSAFPAELRDRSRRPARRLARDVDDDRGARLPLRRQRGQRQQAQGQSATASFSWEARNQ